MRVARASANDRQLDFGSRRPAQRPHAVEDGHFASRFVVDCAQVVAGPEPGFGRRRSVARGDDAQIVLPREIDTDIAGRERRRGFDLLHLDGREVGAVGVEAFRQTVHRAAHDLRHVNRFDVIVRNQIHDIVEDLQVLVRALTRRDAAQQPAEDGKCDDRRRDPDDDAADSGGHGHLFFSHCKGSTARPSTRSSKYSPAEPVRASPTDPTG